MRIYRRFKFLEAFVHIVQSCLVGIFGELEVIVLEVGDRLLVAFTDGLRQVDMSVREKTPVFLYD